jgi:hypothetical protein
MSRSGRVFFQGFSLLVIVTSFAIGLAGLIYATSEIPDLQSQAEAANKQNALLQSLIIAGGSGFVNTLITNGTCTRSGSSELLGYKYYKSVFTSGGVPVTSYYLEIDPPVAIHPIAATGCANFNPVITPQPPGVGNPGGYPMTFLATEQAKITFSPTTTATNWYWRATPGPVISFVRGNVPADNNITWTPSIIMYFAIV